MTKKIVHLIICLSTCLSIEILARPSLGFTARSWAPTANPLPDQARSQPVLPAPAHFGFPGPRSAARAGVVRAGVVHLCRTDRCRLAQMRLAEKAGPPAPPPSDNDQARTGRLTATITISQPLSLYRPLEAVTSHPHYEVLLSPTMPVSISYEAVTGRYSAVLPRLFSGEPNHPVLPDESYTTQLGESLTGDAIRPQATCMVNSTADSGPDSLRSCLQNAQAGDTITFNTTVFPAASPATISLQSALPAITADNLTIDASDAGVILDGSGLSSGDGFVILSADGVKIRGLQILHFPRDGIAIASGATNTVIGGDRSTGSGLLGQGNLISGNGRVGVLLGDGGTMSNTVLGNYIGTDISGAAALGNALHGVAIGFEATNNIIGGNTSGTRNLISGNRHTGVWIQNTGTSGNHIVGNYIGTDVSGTAALGNLNRGISIGFGASNNVIGGASPGAGNLISGNQVVGILVLGPDTASNQMLGNFIGTDVTGASALGNLQNGVAIVSGASNNIIGGDTASARNLISGNEAIGILLQNPGTTSNHVLGNFIGTDVTGTTALGNFQDGIVISFGASNNIVGGTAPGAGNLISGNEFHGIAIETGATGNQVLGNFIGTDASGAVALGNLQFGIVILAGASNNIVGGATSAARNLVSGNDGGGIWLQGAGTASNTIQGNFVGTDVAGTAALGNLDAAIQIGLGASNNIIGGASPGAGNLVSGNDGGGIWLQGAGTASNTIQGNFVGTDVAGTGALGNLLAGIFIGFGASNNVIGGTAPGAGNLISGNGDAGIHIQGTGTAGNLVLGNFIGTDAAGTMALGNLSDGIAIIAGASNNLIGGASPEAGNLISGNERVGIWLQSTGTTGNQVRGNSVGTNVDGTVTLSNFHGIAIGFGASNNLIGGASPGAGNLISGNELAGIWLQDSGTAGNQILGNFIGTDGSSTAALGNLGDGIFIGSGASNNLVGGETISVGNTIASNGGDGVHIDGSQTLGNTISHNSIQDNAGLGIETTNGGNAELPPPTITMVISASVSGQTGPNYIVEVFSDNDGEGRWFEENTIADGSGVFTLTYSGVFRGCNLTATATDAGGNTSEISTPFPVKDCSSRIFLPIIFKSSG